MKCEIARVYPINKSENITVLMALAVKIIHEENIIKSNGFDFSNWLRTKKVIAKNAAEWRSLRLIFFFWGGMEEKYDDDDDEEVGGGGIALRV